MTGTHGGIISIFRWYLGEEFTVEEALAEPIPAVYPIAWEGEGWIVDR